MAQPVAFSWRCRGLHYSSLYDVRIAGSATQRIALEEKIIIPGRTTPIRPRNIPRIGSRTTFGDHFHHVVYSFGRFADRFVQARSDIPLQHTLRKIELIADALHHALSGQRQLYTDAVVTTVAGARDLIDFAARVHPNRPVVRGVVRTCGSLTSARTCSLFLDLAAQSSDWTWGAIHPRVEWARILDEWGFPVNPKYLWIPLVDDTNTQSIASHFDKDLMLPV